MRKTSRTGGVSSPTCSAYIPLPIPQRKLLGRESDPRCLLAFGEQGESVVHRRVDLLGQTAALGVQGFHVVRGGQAEDCRHLGSVIERLLRQTFMVARPQVVSRIVGVSRLDEGQTIEWCPSDMRL